MIKNTDFLEIDCNFVKGLSLTISFLFFSCLRGAVEPLLNFAILRIAQVALNNSVRLAARANNAQALVLSKKLS